jgi:hypothetical protein
MFSILLLIACMALAVRANTTCVAAREGWRRHSLSHSRCYGSLDFQPGGRRKRLRLADCDNDSLRRQPENLLDRQQRHPRFSGLQQLAGRQPPPRAEHLGFLRPALPGFHLFQCRH